MGSGHTIAVVGPECSGTRWISELFRNHKEVDSVDHRSYPEAPPPCRKWPDLRKLHPRLDVRVAICCRDHTITCKSEVKSGFTRWEIKSDPENARRLIGEQVEIWHAPVAVVSYECMVQWPKITWRQTLRLLGLSEVYDYSCITPIDGNAKYFDT